MERLAFLAAATLLVAGGCVEETDSFSLSVVLENQRSEAAEFRVTLENASNVVVWNWNQTVALGAEERSRPIVLPDGLYDMLALTDEASCDRGPGRYEAARITLFIELPELGRTSRYDGTTWAPEHLNCVYMHEDDSGFPWP